MQLVDIPTDNLLDHPPALAEVDGIPGFQSLLAVPLSSQRYFSKKIYFAVFPENMFFYPEIINTLTK